MAQCAIYVDKNNYVGGVFWGPDNAPLPGGLTKIDAASLPKTPLDYRYENGKFVYDSLNEREQLKENAVNDTLTNILDLQIRLSTLELTAEE